MEIVCLEFAYYDSGMRESWPLLFGFGIFLALVKIIVCLGF